jgi:alpha-tubulin suppressor-like RCC1 family protein
LLSSSALIQVVACVCVAAPAGVALGGAVVISAGNSLTCAIVLSGGVRCWGYNSNGQCGNGGTTDLLAPLSTDITTTALSITTGDMHACALTKNFGVQCWGFNNKGQVTCLL